MVKPQHLHSPLTLERGAGCALSSFQRTLYANDCTSPSPIITYLKYSDDTAILVLLSESHDYQNTIAHFTQWCVHNPLHLNVINIK